MSKDMFHIDAILDELDIGNEPEAVPTNVDNPPFVLVLEVVQ
jgi:hypothetical protein